MVDMRQAYGNLTRVKHTRRESLAMPPLNAAARSGLAAMTAVGDHDRAAWLSCYAEDAALWDPVGGSPLDPEGAGLRGRSALETFWDLAVEPHRIRFDVAAVHPGGSDAAVVASAHLRLDTGVEVEYDGVFVYTAGEDGRLTRLRAFWDVQTVVAAMAAPPAVPTRG